MGAFCPPCVEPPSANVSNNDYVEGQGLSIPLNTEEILTFE